MADLNPIYNSTLTCPVCDKKIEVTKVRSRFVKLISQDEDFCPYYETYNPVLYEAWVCKYCGYAAHSTVLPKPAKMTADRCSRKSNRNGQAVILQEKGISIKPLKLLKLCFIICRSESPVFGIRENMFKDCVVIPV